MILFQQRGKGKAALACGQSKSPCPAVLPNRGDQELGALGGQAVVRGAQTPAGAFALMLEADAPVGAFDVAAIGFDADGPEEVKFLPTRRCITFVYAITSIHRELRYAKLRQASTLIYPINTGQSAMQC